MGEDPTGTFLTGGVVNLINCTVAPWRSSANPAADNINGMNFGTTTGNTHSAVNCVTAGGIGRAEVSPGVYYEENGYQSLKGTVTGNFNMTYGSALAGTDYYTTDGNTFDDRIDQYFVDYQSGNLRPVPGGLISGNGVDASALLPSGSWVTGFDFQKDADGVSFAWDTNPPIGAYLS